MEQELLFFNGIDAPTGAYLQSPMPVSDASRPARGEALDSTHLDELKARQERESQGHYGTIEGVDPKDLAQTGWGVAEHSYDWHQQCTNGSDCECQRYWRWQRAVWCTC